MPLGSQQQALAAACRSLHLQTSNVGDGVTWQEVQCR